MPAPEPPFRPPAVPLLVCDPYFSLWSFDDALAAGPTRHWTGTPQPLGSLVRVDGVCFRLMGSEPGALAPLPQTGVRVHPLRTVYTFAGAGVRVSLTFVNPLLPDDLDVLSRPMGYLAWEVAATDGREHAVALCFDAPGLLAVDRPEQRVSWSRVRLGTGLTALRIGSQDQPVLQRSGDNLRIDWGHLYLAFPAGEGTADAVGERRGLHARFAASGCLPEADGEPGPRAASALDALAVSWELGPVGPTPVRRHALLAYDDGYSVEYLQRRLRPYWRRAGWQAADLLVAGAADYERLDARCAAFDSRLEADLAAVGGPDYADLGCLAFRQALAAQKLCADVDGSPLYFSKENFSNGCIATVDVLYPASPQLLLFNPELLAAALRPLLQYAGLPRWPHPFAPHDLGTYPLANGQVYGGGEAQTERQMPVEESGNMLLLAAALAEWGGPAAAAFLQPHLYLLTRWADYLLEQGFDPERQLCTDDFTGHLAHNANLSIKAILALAAHGRLCARLGRPEAGERHQAAAAAFAALWEEAAREGDHHRLAFDLPDSWSQKYNLAWDRVLGLQVFPSAVARREVAHYRTRMQAYGLPLDSRHDWAKVDWSVWTATLAERTEDFRAIVDPLRAFLHASESRVPLTDWYRTSDARQVAMQARSVVGGVFMPLLAAEKTGARWGGGGTA